MLSVLRDSFFCAHVRRKKRKQAAEKVCDECMMTEKIMYMRCVCVGRVGGDGGVVSQCFYGGR